MAAQKSADQYLIAAGCLTQRYGLEVAQQVPGIDGIIGTRRWMDIIDVVKQLRTARHPEPVYHLPDAPLTVMDEGGVQRVAVQGASAYLKIADGCRRPCAFCAIPIIKGTAVSRPAEAILEEVRHLQDRGIKELILIAQDTTDYGHDLGIKNGLADLLTKMVADLQKQPIFEDGDQQGIRWIRIMYAFPGYVTDRLIDVGSSPADPTLSGYASPTC
jgi:ribosomal protein S12 methylthiotransferase